VRNLLEAAFNAVDLNWEDYVETDPKLIRPAEVDVLCGDATKAQQKLGWVPEVNFDELIHMMVQSDIEAVQRNEERHAVAAVSGRNGR
jgi:GDPmannose 4,6-dehydratase